MLFGTLDWELSEVTMNLSYRYKSEKKSLAEYHLVSLKDDPNAIPACRKIIPWLQQVSGRQMNTEEDMLGHMMNEIIEDIMKYETLKTPLNKMNYLLKEKLIPKP